ncbi:YkvS family protein [[Brevibacterium] frigoritolerans]|nr:YkvS family protein [Peribacillus frigoritolerans]
MIKAETGQTIEARNGIVGIVEKVNENSVMIKILKNPTETTYVNMLTIINHKNYKIKKAAV